MTIPAHFNVPTRPIAHPDAIVQVGSARFTVLTARLIRLEYSPSGHFEDRPSLVFWNRELPVPAFEWRDDGQTVEILTGELHLRYRKGTPFGADSLQIHVRATDHIWRFGDPARGNLGGTLRTLDQVWQKTPLNDGLISRDGWSVVDDSASWMLDERGWIAPRAPDAALDLYFFGYGHDYKACQRDFCAVAGSVPIIPRYTLGNWWSRYWKYTADDLQALMQRFQREGFPLSICVIDMDWHITRTGNASTGWTGYTWNRDYFPDPAAFIAWLHEEGLRTCLNVHPADGVYPHESMYPEMARRMGVDPASEQPIPFRIHDPEFAQAYFELLHHPHEAIGVDFWWLDLQHDNYPALPGFDPMLWMNHLHAIDLARDGARRPYTFSRYGRLGNHRSQSAFVGDSYVRWEVMAFTPYFTATAANVNFGWWSNEIGGHFFGYQEGELFTRWVQFGALSPALRLHSGSNPYEERHPWGYDANVYQAVRAAMRFRHQLIPYLYTMAWRNHAESLAPLLPMYYEYPEAPEAYAAPNQYMFGSELIAAPFIHKAPPELGLSRQVVWLPEGGWYDFFSGEALSGGTWHAIYGGLNDMPLFAKAGGIVPLTPVTDWGGVENPPHLIVRVFAGADGEFALYEDDGSQHGTHSFIRFRQDWADDQLTFEILPLEGETAHLPPARTYTIEFVGVSAHTRVDGVSTPTSYDAQTETLTLTGIALPYHSGLRLTLTSAERLLSQRDRRPETVRRMLRAFVLDSAMKLVIDRALPEILQDPAQLLANPVLLDDIHARALLEVVSGAGIDVVTTAMQDDVVVTWNGRADAGVRTRWSTWNFVERFQGENGIAPRSLAQILPRDRQWKLKMSYYGEAVFEVGNAYLDYTPGSTERYLEGIYRRWSKAGLV